MSYASLILPAGKYLLLDLNDYVLDQHLNEQSSLGSSAITVDAGAMHTIRDRGGTDVITVSYCDDGGGVRNFGTLTPWRAAASRATLRCCSHDCLA